MHDKLLATLAGWTAGVLAVACLAVALGSGAVDATAAAQPTATTPVAATPTTVATTTTAVATTTTTTSTTSTTSTTAPATPSAGAGAGVARTHGPILLVWTYGGLPGGLADRIAALDQVTSSTTVDGDLVRLLRTVDAAGQAVDTAPTWWAYPLDALAIDPAGFAPFMPEPDRTTLAALAPGQVILTETSAALRRLGVGGAMTFGPDDVSLTVAGIVADTSGSGAEVLVHRTDAGRIGIDTPRFVLATDTDRAAVESAVQAATPPGKHLSLRGSDDTRWLRHGDRVDPQILVKQTFGEFTFHDGDPASRDILVDQTWVDANIVTDTVPILGEIRCHRLIVPIVREIMQELEATGNADAIDVSNYAGCQYGRRIAPGAGISRHSWGIALDLNVGGDPRGDFATQSDALVAAFRRRGFNWGGDWENYPDPAHYEKQS